MDALHAEDGGGYGIAALCRALGISKQSYYKYSVERHGRTAALEAFAVEFALGIRRVDPGIGIRKLWRMYRAEFPAEARLGRDKFEDLMARYGLKVRNKPRRIRTTDSSHGFPLYPNMVRELIPERVNQLWTSDITYIPLFIGDDRRFCYLSLITDAYSHEIVGWAVGLTLDAHYPLTALEMALKRLEGRGERPIHHSDRGIQYACRRYTRALTDNGIRISMTESGDPKENAYAERVNSTIKNELLKGRRFHSLADVRTALRDAVDFYNNRRPHMSVDMLTPTQAALLRGEIPKKWHSFRETAIKKKGNVVGNS